MHSKTTGPTRLHGGSPSGQQPGRRRLAARCHSHSSHPQLLHQANGPKDMLGFLLSLEVPRLWLEEGQAVGSFFGSIRKLESHFFCTSQKIGEFEAEYLREGKG